MLKPSAVFGRYAEFEGRASRPEFGWWVLFTALVGAAVNVLSVVPVGDGASVGSILSGLWVIATLLPTLAVTVRRLRDAGHPWQNVFWVLVPIAGLIVLAMHCSKPGQPAPA